MLFRAFFSAVILAPFYTPSWSDESSSFDNENALSILEQVESIKAIEPSRWGIRNGCISVNRISSIKFRDDQLAIIDVRGKKQVLLRLKQECRGIAKQGFSYQVRGGQLCENFNSLTQAQSGMKCEIGSIQPHVRLLEDQP
jgi:hypothetical protein